jgi:hypothetical protein
MTIVKIQIPISPRGGPALLYDETRTWLLKMEQEELPSEVRQAALRDWKTYWHVATVGSVLRFGKQAPAQDW